MKSSVKLRPCRWDALVAAVILAVSFACTAGFWLQNRTGTLEAVVSVDGTETERIDVASDSGEHVYTNNGYTLHVTVSGDQVWVSQADCPNQDCVHTGQIDTAGQSIVCLPARISIRLVRTADSGGVDAVIG